MKQTTGRILKSNQVNVEGKCQLGLSHAVHSSHENINNTLQEPKVRIIENNEGYVVIQVICSCGEQINLKADYNIPNKN